MTITGSTVLSVSAILSVLQATAVVAQVTLSVQANGKATPISPYIYCLNDMDVETDFAKEISLPLNRWGGNAVSRYNYTNKCTNRAADWYFENTDVKPALEDFITKNQQTNTKVLLTVPANGYVAKDCASCGFPTSGQKSDKTDQYRPNCGNGESGGKALFGQNPTQTSNKINPAFVTQMVKDISGKFKSQIIGWELDNEPDLWQYNHRDVIPKGVTCPELEKIGTDYGNAVKAGDSATKVFGPVVSGWRAMFQSPANIQNSGNSDCPGGAPLLKDYIKKVCNGNSGKLLDYVDLHYYESASGVMSKDGNVADTRVATTRTLYDKTYEDPSWLKDIKGATGGTANIALIPTLKQWIAENCPGSKIAISEWSFGGSDCPKNSGAVSHADALGIFGREGVDVACYWNLGDEPMAKQQNMYAMRMFRNYDGEGGKFGDLSVPSNSSDQTKVSIFAAQDSKTKKLTAVIVNKTPTQQTANIQVQGTASAGRRKRQAGEKSYQYTGGTQIKPGPAVKIPGTITLPPNSVTTVELGTGSASSASPAAGPAASG